MDFARSDDPRVQAQLDRLNALSLATGRINLDCMTALMDRLGNPQDRLPPVFHVAGTNGKGSVCAFLRAMLEAQGYKVHVTTSPHLVRYNERIRIAGELISDALLAELLKEVFDAADGLSPSFFEVTIAVAFLAFSRESADACLVEVGLGGRLDATNVLKPHALAACGIAALGIDHEKFLLAPEEGVPKEPMARIAFEKAGIAKEGVPLVTMGDRHADIARSAIETVAENVGAPVIQGYKNISVCDGFAIYTEDYEHEFNLSPVLKGQHQLHNFALAEAMLRSQNKLSISQEAIVAAAGSVHWPARMQLLSEGPLTALTSSQQIWLDGGHNAGAGEAIAEAIDGPVHLVIGMLDNKDPRALLDPLGDRVRSLSIVPVPGHDCHPPKAFGANARAASDLEDALLNIPSDDYPILIAGSLYLAGEALKLNDEIPD